MAIDYGQIFTALGGALGGGVGLKIIDSLLIRGKNKDDTAALFRAEQRDEIQRLKSELAETERSLDILKVKYYQLNQELSNIIFQLKFVLDQMERGAVIDLRAAFEKFLEMATGEKFNYIDENGNRGQQPKEVEPPKS